MRPIYIKSVNGVAFPGNADADWSTFARRTFAERAGEGPVLDYDPAIMQPFSQNRYKAMTFVAWHLFKRLARSVPFLLVRGELSDLLSTEIAARMRQRAPAMAYVEVARVGHAPTLGEPAAIEAIRELLSKAP